MTEQCDPNTLGPHIIYRIDFNEHVIYANLSVPMEFHTQIGKIIVKQNFVTEIWTFGDSVRNVYFNQKFRNAHKTHIDSVCVRRQMEHQGRADCSEAIKFNNKTKP